MQVLHELGINAHLLIVNALAFLLVLYLLTRLFFQPFGAFLEQRRAAIEKQMTEAEQARRDAAQEMADLRAEQQAAREQFAREAEAVRKEARGEAQKIVSAAHQAARERRDQTEQDLARQREALRQELGAQTAMLATEIARKALTLSLRPQDQESATEAAVRQVEDLARGNPN